MLAEHRVKVTEFERDPAASAEPPAREERPVSSERRSRPASPKPFQFRPSPLGWSCHGCRTGHRRGGRRGGNHETHDHCLEFSFCCPPEVPEDHGVAEGLEEGGSEASVVGDHRPFKQRPNVDKGRSLRSRRLHVMRGRRAEQRQLLAMYLCAEPPNILTCTGIPCKKNQTGPSPATPPRSGPWRAEGGSTQSLSPKMATDQKDRFHPPAGKTHNKLL